MSPSACALHGGVAARVWPTVHCGQCAGGGRASASLRSVSERAESPWKGSLRAHFSQSSSYRAAALLVSEQGAEHSSRGPGSAHGSAGGRVCPSACAVILLTSSPARGQGPPCTLQSPASGDHARGMGAPATPSWTAGRVCSPSACPATRGLGVGPGAARLQAERTSASVRPPPAHKVQLLRLLCMFIDHSAWTLQSPAEQLPGRHQPAALDAGCAGGASEPGTAEQLPAPERPARRPQGSSGRACQGTELLLTARQRQLRATAQQALPGCGGSGPAEPAGAGCPGRGPAGGLRVPAQLSPGRAAAPPDRGAPAAQRRGVGQAPVQGPVQGAAQAGHRAALHQQAEL